MRIYQPTNEFGQALLNQGQLVATSKAITKGVSDDGTITLTSSDIPGIADWDVRSVSVVIGGETMSFQPDIKRGGSGSIVITFHKAGETIEGLGDATIVLSLVNSDGFIQVLTIEQKIAKAIASHDPAQIRAVAAEAKATERTEYRFATCETYADLEAAGFDRNSYSGENLMCLVNGFNENTCVGMFDGSSITSFSTPLPMLSDGHSMFQGCTSLTSWNTDLPSMTDGYGMFNGCVSLSSFTSDLSALTNGEQMFYGCESLTSFDGDLSSLNNGFIMFSTCHLDQASVDRIVTSINDLASQGKIGTLSLGVADGVIIPTDKFSAKGWSIIN